MSWRFEAMRSTGASYLRASAMALVGVAACGSPKTTAPGPVLGDRRDPPPVQVAPLDGGAARSGGEAAPPPPAFPRTLALGALAEGERIADLAVLAQADRFLLAWVTYFDGGAPALR